MTRRETITEVIGSICFLIIFSVGIFGALVLAPPQEIDERDYLTQLTERQ